MNLHAMTDRVLAIILEPLIIAIASLIVGVLVRQLKKLGLELTAERQEQLKKLAIEAIQAVEEQARRDATMTGADKHSAAVEILKAQRPDLSQVELSHKVDAILPEVRAKLEPSMPAVERVA